MIYAPFTTEQVKSLNDFQQSGYFHPFTCGNENCRADLIATEFGWVCPACEYTQKWAHEFMTNNEWKIHSVLSQVLKEKKMNPAEILCSVYEMNSVICIWFATREGFQSAKHDDEEDEDEEQLEEQQYQDEEEFLLGDNPGGDADQIIALFLKEGLRLSYLENAEDGCSMEFTCENGTVEEFKKASQSIGFIEDEEYNKWTNCTG